MEPLEKYLAPNLVFKEKRSDGNTTEDKRNIINTAFILNE
tara:strand:- start:584 stop:703 length:120 start_codon:yes stop_codon:yes gene_type:complete